MSRIPPAAYFHQAYRLTETEWIRANAITLRSNWRDMLDACIADGDEATANELRNFDVWAQVEYEMEYHRC